jgi:hypothetical protein
MNNRMLARGLFLAAIALAFGLQSLRYPIGSFAHAGAGLFPLMVSSLLLVIAVITLARSRLEAREAVEFNVKNIALVLLSLCGFAVISEFVNMILGIVFMVFCVTFAGTSYSVVRNLKVSAVLIAVAFAFKQLLGLNLPLF